MSSRAEIGAWLDEAFIGQVAAVFESMAGERPVVECLLAAAPPDAALWLQQPFSGAPGAVWIAASDADWSAATAYVLKAAGIEDGDAGTLKATFLELIGQALSGLVQVMSGRLRREVAAAASIEGGEPPGDTQWALVRMRLGESDVQIGLGLETALLDAFVRSPAAPAALPPASSQAPGGSKTFDLLLDVELPVSVSFGRAHVPLKDVLKLNTGSIVELNRTILEPVEVIVNNCVIARGEVVVVEGNFGVRIQEVVSRQERLRTLT